ncbi:Free methionine-R-sulfoxide reductase [Erwinia sp. OLTSP20]|uniref:GAF domain-containing protein n=1 Tax=unclassified Erwinia TaxID=2622719 RepID=UPI000C19795A|nr:MULTISPECIES: GAF domain-containing protein [unclassified Erwinia]PIJ51440.1 Free methionine-R-sulfoxide reductase [Erwinia sp. OAMSP11]PIJ73462.1 Free methionine-R-sulfoxide reductase [Erwinia sp. OLSSP12]PIJ85525.1 Free methionine-R-sulfoxide reductase [Erwinia sp. OLCASP19]PIJ85923.1 Free methionine-R-sulfoxide reductase [Erwinia sp. OLMTSP26]PIJ87404.1 Free methionine-R-sulfoxide reductase [Erwinia sp. OLMDSP33]
MNKQQFYDELNRDLQALVEGETSFLALMSNCSALLYQRLTQVNWAGFYLLSEKNTLVLGPFQGKIACVRIPVGRGVCGSAVSEKAIMRVGDVHAFAGHIACDADSNAEIVLPVKVNGEIIGVLDIDSVAYNRFDAEDEAGLKTLSDWLGEALAATDLHHFLQINRR